MSPIIKTRDNSFCVEHKWRISLMKDIIRYIQSDVENSPQTQCDISKFAWVIKIIIVNLLRHNAHAPTSSRPSFIRVRQDLLGTRSGIFWMCFFSLVGSIY